MSSQIQRTDCPSCPHNKMLSESGCVKICSNNTLNLMNRQCISKKSCEQENSEIWKNFKFVPSNGICKLIKYCDSIEIFDEIDTLAFEKAGRCQVVQGFVEITLSSSSCENYADLPRAIEFLSEIEEIRDYLEVVNSPTPKILGILPKLKIVRGDKLESGEYSVVFKLRTIAKYIQKSLPNYTVSNEIFCTKNCGSNNLKLEITPKTFGFVVKILNKGLKNILNNNVKLTSVVLDAEEYHRREICESVRKRQL